jgi:hypothetical protein
VSGCALQSQVLLLWQVLEELQPAQQAAFLKFVTAVSRPPLLGFRALEPRFCVHRSGVAATDAPDESADTERLPTAATCMVWALARLVVVPAGLYTDAPLLPPRRTCSSCRRTGARKSCCKSCCTPSAPTRALT